jgi:hypothetical protein
MLITITKIIKQLDWDSAQVEFSSRLLSPNDPEWVKRCMEERECFAAEFSSSKPIIEKSYYAEMSLPERLVWGRDVKPVEQREYRMNNENGKILIRGLLERTPDGFLSFTLGESLVNVQIKGVPKTFSGFVQIVTSSIKLTDIGLI